MVLLRTLTIAMFGASLYFMLCIVGNGEQLREVQLVAEPPTPTSATTIVDVAGSVPRDRVASMISLAPGERVIAVGDRAVDSDLEAGAAIAANAPSSGSFLDLTVEGVNGPRRLLVLVH